MRSATDKIWTVQFMQTVFVEKDGLGLAMSSWRYAAQARPPSRRACHSNTATHRTLRLIPIQWKLIQHSPDHNPLRPAHNGGPLPPLPPPSTAPYARTATDTRSPTRHPAPADRGRSALSSLRHGMPAEAARHALKLLLGSRQSPGLGFFVQCSGTKAPSLHRHYPAASVLRTYPSSQPALPGPRGFTWPADLQVTVERGKERLCSRSA